eukprot:1222342-Pyramimonas_sp.AAC.1
MRADRTAHTVEEFVPVDAERRAAATKNCLPLASKSTIETDPRSFMSCPSFVHGRGGDVLPPPVRAHSPRALPGAHKRG